MKKFLLLGAMGLIAFSVHAQDAFDKGDRKMDLAIGVGTVAYADKSRGTFDQHFGMEWGIGRIADKVTIGFGFAVNNIYGGKYQNKVIGEYDYKYTRTTFGKVYNFSTKKWDRINETKKVSREGIGTADADITREDLNALVTISFHYSPIPQLDTYLKIGTGVGYMTYLVGNYQNTDGFQSASVNDHRETQYTDITTRYNYNDLDHVKWSSVGGSKIVPAMATYVGATYFLTESWGIGTQFGLISANIKDKDKGYPNSYGIFAVGATYKF